MTWGEHDIGDERFAWAMEHAPLPRALYDLVTLARDRFGWFTSTPSRVFEYPWVLVELGALPGKQILDLGAGVSPLPLLLARRGAVVVTVDSSPVIRRPGQEQETWNEWGFLDYSEFDAGICSLHQDILAIELAPDRFDGIYSVSVIEHLPAAQRPRIWRRLSRWLRPGGALLLSVDLVCGSEVLWNLHLGREVEPLEAHGDLDTLAAELGEVGLRLENRKLLRRLEGSTTDVALLRFGRHRPEVGHLQTKYSSDYFLGGVDQCSRTYGVPGYGEFRAGDADARHRQELAFTLQVAGPLAGKEVLEIGFGRGDLIPMLLDAGVAAYTGYDFSAPAVGIAAAHVTDSRVRLEQRDATQLQRVAAFDLVALYDTLEHIPVYEMERVWPAIHRTLRPGGHVVVSTPLFDNPNAADDSDASGELAGMHCHKQTLGTLVRSCLRHGFLVCRHEPERLFGLVRAADLDRFDPDTAQSYRATHQRVLVRCGVGDAGGAPESASEGLVPGAGRVAFGCVTENTPQLLAQVLRLLQSLRWFGGRLAGANFFVCVVEEIEPGSLLPELERLGAFVRVVSRVSRDHPPSNKLRLLELAELGAYDTLIMLDCDTLIVQDPWPELDGQLFQAKIADIPSVSQATFGGLFRHFELPLPEQEYGCNPGGEPTIWYCNAGVLVFPCSILPTLAATWRKLNAALLDRLDLLGGERYYCEQASLSLAFAAAPVPFRELPLAMNYPLHQVSGNAPPQLLQCDPVILHYHDMADADGCLVASTAAGAQRRIEQFNRRLRHEERQRREGCRFNNRLFWDARYSGNPALGSGIGSRGLTMVYKRQLLQRMVDEEAPVTIIDVGCGDLATGCVLPERGYLGLDISPVVIERNQTTYPGRRFLCGSLLDVKLEPADMVVCLDVLLHIGEVDRYRAMVGRLLALTGRVGLVSGFETPAASGDITFFHEPLSETLHRAGACHLRKIGAYAEVTVWAFKPPEAGSVAADALGRQHPITFIIGGLGSGGSALADQLAHTPGIALEAPGHGGHVGVTTDPDMCKVHHDPHLCSRLPEIAARHPNAGFILIRRDLPQVVAELRVGLAGAAQADESWCYWPPPSPEATVRTWQAVQRQHATGIDRARCFPGGDVTYLAEYWLETSRAVAELHEALPRQRRLLIDDPSLDLEASLARCRAFLGLHLVGAQGSASRSDDAAGIRWQRPSLTADDRLALLRFVQEQAAAIDALLTTGRAARYRRQLAGAYAGRRPRPAADVWHQQDLVNDGAVLVSAGSAVQVNETGNLIWGLCNGERTVEEIIGALQEVYPDAPEGELAEEAERFVNQLVEAGFLCTP